MLKDYVTDFFDLPEIELNVKLTEEEKIRLLIFLLDKAIYEEIKL